MWSFRPRDLRWAMQYALYQFCIVSKVFLHFVTEPWLLRHARRFSHSFLHFESCTFQRFLSSCHVAKALCTSLHSLVVHFCQLKHNPVTSCSLTPCTVEYNIDRRPNAWNFRIPVSPFQWCFCYRSSFSTIRCVFLMYTFYEKGKINLRQIFNTTRALLL